MAAAAVYSVIYIMVPLTAWTVINEDWQFQVPIIDITYKPWRLFIVLCSSCEIVVAVILIFLPESPKFVLGQGNKAETYRILQQMHRWNNGRNSTLEAFEIYEEIESIENREQILDCQKSQFPLLKSIWIQTAPLFQSKHLLSTVLVCFIQFVLCATSTGFFMFFGQILNKMSMILENFRDERVWMCDVISMKTSNESMAIDEFGEEVSLFCFF